MKLKPLLNWFPLLAIAFLGVLIWQQSKNPNSSSTVKAAGSESWEVVKVSDGDTIEVRSRGLTERVRLCGIDAPEVQHGQKEGQPFGNESREKLRSLIASSGNQVLIVNVERDKYGRMVGEVFLDRSVSLYPEDDVFVNAELVEDGLAYHYAKYSNNCPNRNAIIDAERDAQSKQLSLWSGNYERPWDFRKR